MADPSRAQERRSASAAAMLAADRTVRWIQTETWIQTEKEMVP
jgi:hypothetical protein